MTEFLQRLRDRKLVQWALAYAAAAFALLQGLDIIAQRFGWPEPIERLVIVGLGIGFLVTLVLAWYHGERGAQRASGTELLILALLLAFGGVILWRMSPSRNERTAGAPSAAASPSPRSMPAVGILDKSIAVLPFLNMSGDAKNDYLSDGITEEILDALAQIPELKVAARTSAFVFKGRAEDLRQVGEALGVATVLEGSVQSAGDQLRITAQLIDTRNGYHLWSAKYDRKLTNVFVIEDEISRAIADKLRAQWSAAQPLVRSGTSDPQAHALYLQGIAAIAQRGAALKQAAALLEQATIRDPAYAAAWAQLSQTQELLPWYELAPWPEGLDAAERSARRALALNAQSAEAHAALANVLRDRFAFADAEREYRRSIELNPGIAEVHNQYGQLLDAVGRLDEAIAQEQIAIAKDPIAPNPEYMLGVINDSKRRHDAASAAFERVIQLAPNFIYASGQLVLSRLYAGDFAHARSLVDAVAGASADDRRLLAGLIDALAARAHDPQTPMPPVGGLARLAGTELGGFARAFWYAMFGARAQALDELEQWARTAALGERFNGLRFLWMPAFDSLRGEPRFGALLAGFGVPDLSVDELHAGGMTGSGRAKP